MLWARPLCVCVCLFPLHLPAVLLSESTMWLLPLLKERERRNQRKKREGDRARGGGGGERLKNFGGTSSLRLSSLTPFGLPLQHSFSFSPHSVLQIHSLNIYFLLTVHVSCGVCFLFLSTSSFHIRKKSHNTRQMCPQTSQRIKEGGGGEAHLHRFLCDLPRRRHPSRAPQTDDCWAVAHTNK